MEIDKGKLEHQPLSQLYSALIALEPKAITGYVPRNASEQKVAFLNGDIRNPQHDYDRLDAIDFDERKRAVSVAGDAVLASEEMNPKFISAYEQFIEGYKARTHLMELAQLYNHEADSAIKARLRDEYMKLNIDLYGAPDEVTYRSLLQEKLAAIADKDFEGEAATLRDELFSMANYIPGGINPERFTPSNETMEWMGDIVKGLYDSMLSRIPADKKVFNPQEVKTLFDGIVAEEFGGSAGDWQVDIEEAKAINVKTTEKRIVIPIDREEISVDTLRGLIVHEIGVHMLRAVMGGETNLEPLANGLSNYYDAEEGLGVVMEQALRGKFREAGIDHYITAGLAYFDGKDFRDAYEIKWRLSALEKLRDGEEVTDDIRKKSQNTAYGSTMRSLRGTDELPWFKDLSYYNGAVDIWRHLEEIRGDDIRFMFVLLGKNDPSSKVHERLIYETSSK